jgi:hypothetical protein
MNCECGCCKEAKPGNRFINGHNPRGLPAFHKPSPIETRFWPKVVCDLASGCWLWTGALINTGYGVLGRGGRNEGLVLAHRLSYALAHGVEPSSEMDLCHTCDVRRCVRPDHLFVGTRLDNVRDMMVKGRARFGGTHTRQELADGCRRDQIEIEEEEH